MSMAGSVWNQLNKSWRQLNDSASIAWDFTTNRDTASIGLVDGGVATAKIADDAVTLAKLVNASGPGVILGRKTSGAGNFEEISISDALNFLASTADGDIVMRSGGAWIRLAKGADTNVLTLASGLPSWAAPTQNSGKVSIASGSLSAANVGAVITGIAATYSYLALHISGASTDTATRTLWVQVSTDNGSNYDATAANYNGEAYTNAGGFTNFPANTAPTLTWGVRNAAATTVDVTLMIFGYQGGMYPYANGVQKPSTGSPDGTFATYIGSTSAINALRIIVDGTGNFDAGTFILYGIY